MRLTNSALSLMALALAACDPAAVPGGDGGVGAGWTACEEAVVFGEAGEACSFSGSCVECVRVSSPTQVACAAGVLRFATVGPSACMAGVDGGGVPLGDGGVGPGTDGGGMPGTDAGPRDGGATCGPRTVAMPVGGVCAASIAECERNGGEDCAAGHRGCESCLSGEIVACATAHGCDDEYGAFECCIQTNCPDRSCAATTCEPSWRAFTTCAERTSCRSTDHCYDGSIACGPATAPAPSTAACSAGTRVCLEAAASQEDYDACWAADADPEGCEDCEIDGFMHCVTDVASPDSCAWERGAIRCCLDTACPSGTAPANCWSNAQSPGGACFDEVVDFSNCANARTDCMGVFDACHPG